MEKGNCQKCDCQSFEKHQYKQTMCKKCYHNDDEHDSVEPAVGIASPNTRGPPPAAKASLKPTKAPPTARGGPPPAARGAAPTAKSSVKPNKAPPPTTKAPPPATKAPPPATKKIATKTPAAATKSLPPQANGNEVKSMGISQSNNDAMMDLVGELKINLEIKDRTWRFKKYEQCFVGKDLTTWLVDNKPKLAPNREQAVVLAERLRKTGAFNHVTSGQPFLDGYFFYRFSLGSIRGRANTSAVTQNSGSEQDSPGVESPMFKKDVKNSSGANYVKAGYFLKRMGVGPDALHFWEVKYCVIVKAGSDYRLELYATHEKGRRLGNLILSQKTQSFCMILPRDAFADGGHKLMFGISDKNDGNGKTIILDAESITVRDEWLEVLASINVENRGVQCERINSAAIKEGWVKKAPENFGVWHQRYLILLPNILMYFKWKRDKRPLGAIALMRETVVKEDDVRVNTFILIPNPNIQSDLMRKFVLTCYDASILKRWIVAIRECVQKLQ